MNDGLDGGVDINWKASGKSKADNRNFTTEALDWDADAQEDEDKRKRAKLLEVRLSFLSLSLRFLFLVQMVDGAFDGAYIGRVERWDTERRVVPRGGRLLIPFGKAGERGVQQDEGRPSEGVDQHPGDHCD